MLTIGIIGAGQIGSAIARVLAETGRYRVVASRRRVEKVKDLERLGVKLTRMNREVAEESDVIFISVKPYKVPEVLSEISDLLRDKLLISVAAAISISKLEKLAPEARVVRAMPNIALRVKAGFIAYSRGSRVTDEDIKLVQELFSEMGYCMEVDENLMDGLERKRASLCRDPSRGHGPRRAEGWIAERPRLHILCIHDLWDREDDPRPRATSRNDQGDGLNPWWNDYRGNLLSRGGRYQDGHDEGG